MTGPEVNSLLDLPWWGADTCRDEAGACIKLAPSLSESNQVREVGAKEAGRDASGGKGGPEGGSGGARVPVSLRDRP